MSISLPFFFCDYIPFDQVSSLWFLLSVQHHIFKKMLICETNKIKIVILCSCPLSFIDQNYSDFFLSAYICVLTFWVLKLWTIRSQIKWTWNISHNLSFILISGHVYNHFLLISSSIYIFIHSVINMIAWAWGQIRS